MATATPLELPFGLLDEDGAELGHELPELSDAELKDLYVHMARVRVVDERMLKLQRAGRIGFVGSTIGQEASMIGPAAALQGQDWLWSGLREGGAALMRGLPLSEYIAQMYCNANDTAKGRQMCNHFQHKGSNYPSWSSVIGTQIPHGVGAALAAKRQGKDEVHAIFFGDGASSSNGFHAGMNFAGVWDVPCVFVLVHNGWAISVPSDEQTGSAEWTDKALAYGLPGYEVDGNCVLASYAAMKALVDRARNGGGPSMLVVKTYRMLGHSSSDDPSVYRSDEEVEPWQRRDPLRRYSAFLEGRGILAEGEADQIMTDLTKEVDHEIHVQEDAPRMPLRSLVEDVYQDIPRHLREQYNDFIEVVSRHGEASPGDGAFPL